MKACSEMSLFRCAILIKVSFKLKIWIAWGKSNFTPLMTRSFISNYIFDSLKCEYAGKAESGFW